MKQSFITFMFVLFSAPNLQGQYQINGKVVDAETKESLAFANLTFNNSKTRGVITDIDGKFFYKSDKPIKSIEISYLGYETLKLKPDAFQDIVIALKPTLENLDEVVITNTENPALRIIRQVMTNKELNNPLKKGGFSYTSYNKSIVDVEGRQKKSDSLRQVFLNQIKKGELDPENDTLNGFEKTLIREGNFNIMLFESVTKRKFLPPDLSEETVVATRVSGFKNPYFTVLATELQPFGFYQDNINLMDLHFLNPIAKGSLKHYDYTLKDKILRDNDTIFNISFQPKPGANIDGLKGFMYINSDGYAIQNVVTEPYDKLITHLKIQQKYKHVEDKTWFPEQLNFEFTTQQGVFINSKTYIKDIKFLDSLSPKDFDEVQLKYEENAPSRNEEFWNQYRIDSLSQIDKTTYKVIDSIGERLKSDKILDVATALVDGYIPWGKFNIPYNRFFGYNRYEGFRLGAGLETNKKLFKNFILGGYTAYGFKDNEWKFGGKARYNIDKSKDMFLQFNYNNDLREIGRSTLNNQNFSSAEDLRDIIAFTMDMVEHYQLEFGRRDFKYLTWHIALRNEWIRPKYDYTFVNNSNNITNFRNSEAILNLRYAFRERLVETPQKRISLGTNYPVVNMRYTNGFDSFLNGDFNYQKIEVSLSQSFFIRNLGQTHYHIQAGYIDSNIPLGLLFTNEGSNDNDIPIVMPDTFQTMLPYEFLSDRYVNLFLTHDLGSLLFKTKTFNPGLVIHHNMSWGNIDNPQSHIWNFKTKDKIFIESGLEVTKLIKLNYFDTFYLGIGAGGFYRYGHYSFDKASDNFVFKMNITFTLN
ncbi:DUF5686 and carboxypeptidase-like regulatory domain-containing protein [Flavobacterium sp. CS20]|uniref:DUF5686 and carboxypeptidase-like regulatory domain-containing protein n=1 Tax=Flavobacterium sp. CS20 TaxID=2775246 RepID=UPI001B3A649B|nr:DUF5686 and carboxypeptidase-like regulatory domain-containing protein [Flavobacterium sp. CS20]QTY26096.1 carboxypeptidase-like regulatory domain-containing protein [Flavobacterium sp. CS20]